MEMALGFDLEHNLRFKDNIGKYVKIKTVDSSEYEGWLKCIDPITGNFFLITFDDNFEKVRNVDLFMGDGCSSMEVLKDSDENVKSLLKMYPMSQKNPKVVHEVCPEDTSDKKKRLIAWIKTNRLPVVESEDGSLIVGGNVTVKPPYGIQDCSSLNARTLKSIRKIVSKLPSDIELSL